MKLFRMFSQTKACKGQPIAYTDFFPAFLRRPKRMWRWRSFCTHRECRTTTETTRFFQRIFFERYRRLGTAWTLTGRSSNARTCQQFLLHWHHCKIRTTILGLDRSSWRCSDRHRRNFGRPRAKMCRSTKLGISSCYKFAILTNSLYSFSVFKSF